MFHIHVSLSEYYSKADDRFRSYNVGSQYVGFSSDNLGDVASTLLLAAARAGKLDESGLRSTIVPRNDHPQKEWCPTDYADEQGRCPHSSYTREPPEDIIRGLALLLQNPILTAEALERVENERYRILEPASLDEKAA